MLPSSLLALVRHQLRLLAQNHCACLILVMFAVVAALAPRIEPPQRPVCYVLYWQDDPWVERLRAELPQAGQAVDIEFVPAARFADREGVIAYPPGAHSIQLRPPVADREHWLVWFWYAGARADVLNPLADRFWSITRRHFGDQPAMDVRVSALGSRLAILDVAGPVVRSFVAKGEWKIPIVWGALFFCGCYLPAMALAQQRDDRTIFTLVTTPAGWAGVGLATCGFYFVLTLVLSLSLAMALGCGSGFGMSSPLLVAAAIYVAVGFTLGCWCNGTASASAGMLVYMAGAGAIGLLAGAIPGLSASQLSVELQILRVLQEAPTAFVGVPASMAAWGMLWFLIARRSFFRLQLQ
jgi:hypothetical protein